MCDNNDDIDHRGKHYYSFRGQQQQQQQPPPSFTSNDTTTKLRRSARLNNSSGESGESGGAANSSKNSRRRNRSRIRKKLKNCRHRRGNHVRSNTTATATTSASASASTITTLSSGGRLNNSTPWFISPAATSTSNINNAKTTTYNTNEQDLASAATTTDATADATTVADITGTDGNNNTHNSIHPSSCYSLSNISALTHSTTGFHTHNSSSNGCWSSSLGGAYINIAIDNDNDIPNHDDSGSSEDSDGSDESDDICDDICDDVDPEQDDISTDCEHSNAHEEDGDEVDIPYQRGRLKQIKNHNETKKKRSLSSSLSSFKGNKKQATNTSNTKFSINTNSQLLITPPHPQSLHPNQVSKSIISAFSYKNSRNHNSFSKENNSNQKQKHRYRLRSSHQCIHNEYDEEGSNSTAGIKNISTKKKFIDFDVVSAFILSSQQYHHHHHHQQYVNSFTCELHPSSILQSSSLESTTLSHAFLQNYGSMHYQSLLEREEKQHVSSKERMDDFRLLYREQQLNEQKQQQKQQQQQQQPQRRMRTRSFCNSERNDYISTTSGSISPLLPKEETTSFKEKDNTKNHTHEDTKKTTPKSNLITPRYIQVKKQPHINANMRCIIVDWIISVMKEFKLAHETLHCCIYLLDRSLEEIVVTKNTFHALACGCLLISSKLVEVKHPRAADIAFFTSNACTVTDICKMELEITNVLQFHLQFVTAYHFIPRFINASHFMISDSQSVATAPRMMTNAHKFHQRSFYTYREEDNMDSLDESSSEEDENGAVEDDNDDMLDISNYSYIVNNKLECMVLYFLDMSLLIPEFVDMKKSLVAAAAVYIARAIIGIRDMDGKFWGDTMTHYIGYEVEELAGAVSLLYDYQNRYIIEENNKKRRAIFKKYNQKEFLEVAKKALVLFDDLELNTH